MAVNLAYPSTPLRVLQVTPRYFPYMGGTETHVYEVGRRLAGRDVDVTVLTTDPTRRLPADEVIDGVRVCRVPAWPAQKDYYFALDILRVVAQGCWDLVHCQGCHTLVPPFAMLAALQSRIPYVLTFHLGGHSSSVRRSLRGLQWTLLRPLLQRAARLIAVSEFEASFFQQQVRLPADRFVVIPNGSNLPEVDEKTPARHEGTLITSVGRLEHYKGHQRVIAALPKVIANWPDVHLKIVGSGPYEAALREQAVALGIADRVHIGAIPATDRAGMARVLARSALVTLLSEAESNPVAVMEAVALGRSVLVADTSGLRELAQRGLVRAIALESQADDVAAAILNQLRHPHVPPTVALPTWDGCAADLLEVYRSVARRATCAS